MLFIFTFLIIYAVKIRSCIRFYSAVTVSFNTHLRCNLEVTDVEMDAGIAKIELVDDDAGAKISTDSAGIADGRSFGNAALPADNSCKI